MKSIIKKSIAAFGICFLLISLSSAKALTQPRNGVSLQVFYDELSYYGDWIDNPDYGYVWRPNVGSDFRPYYTNGHWVMTEYGNTWVSDYEWGWAPFHYGRWFYDRYDGWIWMPDTEWGPAWVSWRTGGGYYGWAPLGPRVSINISIGRNYYIPYNYWVFIPQRCIYYPSYGRFYDPRRSHYYYSNTTIINNIYINNNVRYASGPRVEDVRRATRQDVPVYRIADDNRPGSTRVSRNEVKIYRPEVSRGGNDRSAPRAIANNSGRPSRTEGNVSSGRSNDDSYNSRSSSNGNDVRSSNPRPDVSNREDRSSNSARTERSEPSRSNSPSRTESTDTNRPERVERPSSSSRESSPARTESAPSNNRVERPASSPRESAPSRSQSSGGSSQRVERSQPSNNGSSSSSRSSSPSSRGNSSSNGRPSR